MTNRRVIGDGDWASLEVAIRSGKCVLMLGAGAVTEQADGARVPVLDALANHLASRLGDVRLVGRSAADIGQAIEAEKDPNTLLYWIKEHYDGRELDDPTLTKLASLPFKVIVNSVPGARVEDAFADAGKQPQVAAYDYTAALDAAAPIGTVEEPLVYHLFGSLDNLQSLVVSESALLDFLIAAVSRTPPVPNNLSSILRSKRTSFLFLGFQLYTWPFRVLVHALFAKEARDNRSFALEGFDPSVHLEVGDFYWGDHKISFFDMDLADFVDQLVARIGPVDDIERHVQTAPPLDAPVAFICHASEDKEAAVRLAEALRSEGIRVWIDKDDLRGGDRWPEVIRYAINAEIDYFIVVQSRHLAARELGYVNREITYALERQKDFRPPRRFIVPVQIDADPSNRLTLLGDVQTVPLDDWGRGVRQLASTIRKDVARAQR